MKNKTAFLILFFSLTIIACESPKEKLANKIRSNETILFGDSLKTLNDSIALSTIDLYITFADQFQEDNSSPEYLFKSADLALGVKQPQKALESLQLLRKRYPESNKASAALFMQAFILETAIEDKEGAKKLFLEFIEKYPSDPLTGSAQASYDQLAAGISDEDLIRMFESKQDSAAIPQNQL